MTGANDKGWQSLSTDFGDIGVTFVDSEIRKAWVSADCCCGPDGRAVASVGKYWDVACVA